MIPLLLISTAMSASAAEPATHTAPAGGDVVNDAGLAWKVTVPEGWTWTESQDGGPVMIATPGAAEPSKPGDIACRLSKVAAVAGRTQAEINAGAREHMKDAAAAMKKNAAKDVLPVAFSEASDFKGVTRTIVLGPSHDDGTTVEIEGFAGFGALEGGALLACSGPFVRGDKPIPEEPVLKSLKSLLKSLEPL